jgi:hypothetical protein
VIYYLEKKKKNKEGNEKEWEKNALIFIYLQLCCF